MLTISRNGIIEINRGDYAEIPLFINQGDKNYPIRYSLTKDTKATVVFGIMTPQQTLNNAIVKKYYNNNSPHTSQKDLIIVLEPRDTLRLTPGKYYYSVDVNLQEHGETCSHTVIPKRIFIVKE